MKTTLLALLLLPFAAFATPTADQIAPNIRIEDASVEAVPTAGDTLVTARFINPTSDTIVVTKLSSPLALNSRLVLFGKNPEGLTTMSEQSTLLLPPGETLTLPNVLEWRLESLEYGLSTGNEIPLTLTFTNGTTRTYKALVK